MTNGREVITLDDDVPVEIKQMLIQQQTDLWVRTRYDARVRLRVQKAIGDEAQQAAIIKDLESCEKALDTLRAERAALPEVPS